MLIASEPPARNRSRILTRLCSRADRSTSTHAGRRAASRSCTSGVSCGGSASPASERSATGLHTLHAMTVEIAEAGRLPQEHELDGAGLAIAMLGDDQLREPLVLVLGVVDLIAIDEGDHIGVLFNRARLA